MAKKNPAKRLFGKILSVLGSILIISSLLIIFYTFAPAIRQEITYESRGVLNIGYKNLTPPNTDFSIVIPKIGAVAPVFADVDPLDPKKYLPVLKKGVAHAKGTAFPGELGNTYLFAHSTDAFYNVGRYNAVFYLLGKLKKGDEIEIYYKGEKIKYGVNEVKVVEPTAIKYLGKIDDGRTLTLQTCYPPGTTLKRLVVVASQLNN